MDIVAVVVLFLTHIEWSHGNVYSFLYVQITDRNLNTDLEDDRFSPVKSSVYWMLGFKDVWIKLS